MTHQDESSILEDVLKVLTLREPEGLKSAIAILMNAAMKIEREQVLQAAPYERSEERTGYGNGFKDKTISTRLGKIGVKVPQVRGDVEFYPSSLEKGIRSERALKLAIAEMYVKGVSTRKVSDVVEQLCGTSVSSAQVSAAAKMLDEESSAWRNRPLGRYQYLMLDARYENVRQAGSVASCAVVVAIGIDYEGRRDVLGVSACLSEAEVHWRTFLDSLIKRGMHGLRMIISDAHSGLGKAREACFPGVPWQRCQFHLQQCFKSSEIPGKRHLCFPENATGNSRLSPSGFLPWMDHSGSSGLLPVAAITSHHATFFRTWRVAQSF